MGLIEEQAAEGTRKKFAITDAGRAHLDENAEEVAALMTRLAQVGEMPERTERAPIRRAMGNLRQVPPHRLTRDDVGAAPLLCVPPLHPEAGDETRPPTHTHRRSRTRRGR